MLCFKFHQGKSGFGGKGFDQVRFMLHIRIVFSNPLTTSEYSSLKEHTISDSGHDMY
jgi:hypothetical protein